MLWFGSWLQFWAAEQSPHFAADVSILIHNNIYVIIAEIDCIWLFLEVILGLKKTVGETKQFVIKRKMST